MGHDHNFVKILFLAARILKDKNTPRKILHTAHFSKRNKHTKMWEQ